MERGLTLADMKGMQLGQVVDFCIDYNYRHNPKEAPPKIRKATQEDVNRFFGG